MIVIDYVDGRARTERITDSSSTTRVETSSAGGGSSGLITEVTIQPHDDGTFVDSSDSSGSPPPPPHPPRNPQMYHHLHSYHTHHHHQGNHRYHLHMPPPPPPGRPPSGSGTGTSADSSSGYHSSGGGGVGNGGQHGHHGGRHGKTGLRTSHSSDSSSAYSGSDTMQSAPSSSNADVAEEVDLSGLMESVVDSDEEDGEEGEESLLVRDAVRECLEKDPSDRTEEDVDTLLEFTQHLKAFTNMTLSVRRALVATMVFAVVEKAGTMVMTDGEELDSWSVIINGHVEVAVEDNGSEDGSSPTRQELHLGDSFGITPTMDKLYHRGVMRTKCDDCQFVCVTQTDYYRILHQGEESQRRHEENGQVVLVTENRLIADPQQQSGANNQQGGSTSSNSNTSSATNTANNNNVHARKGHLVIRGTPRRLMGQLMEDNSDVDPTYIEDFLLTYRTFLATPTVLADQLLDWFKEPSLRDKVTRVLLLWVNNHFTDFETDPAMMDFLEKFEVCLENEKMHGQLRMLNFACAAKARKRTVTLTRPSRDEPLQFSIIGGYERGFGIFISRVEKGSKAEEIGLKRGDQILEVNGQSFEHSTKHARALEILKGVCHLSVTVKSNLLAFQEMLQTPEDTPRSRSRGKSAAGRLTESGGGGHLSTGSSSSHNELDGRSSSMSMAKHSTTTAASSSRDNTPTPSQRGGSSATKKISAGGNAKSKINRAFNRFLHKPKSLINMDTLDGDTNVISSSSIHYSTNSVSNPDLLRETSAASSTMDSDKRSEYPEDVLKVYKADQTFKYLLVHKETTAHEVVMLSLQEFGITEPSSNYSLCEVVVAEGGFVKQRTLPDPLQNLAERIGLASRYYIKNKNSSESLLPDEYAHELKVKEVSVNLLQLNPVEVSTQLMVEDFTIFRQIEATEYVDDLYATTSKYGTPSLTQFAELVNREMMWTIGEIVSEANSTKRMRIIKQFIKVARQCKETRNFNSMFAIISGLGHGAVSRLKSSWEKLPSKYQRLFNEMQQLMDPSRNMSRYRNLVNGEDIQPPIIPFYPVVKKDLTFIHLANDSVVDSLVNFEKMRMIAKEVRSLINMCSAPLDLFSMLELGGQQPSNAMVAMNQLTTGGQNLATVNRRRKKTTGVPNPKRMFEEAQMVRRVKAYLKNMKVITDEEKLHAMSLEVEPPSAGGVLAAVVPHGLGQPSLRKRNPSPTPSAVSSASSTSAEKKVILAPSSQNHHNHPHNLLPPGAQTKFGAASPQAVKKLLSLSEPNSKLRPKTISSSASPSFVRKGSGSGAAVISNPHKQAVDLTAESSSVTSLPTIIRGKGHGVESISSSNGIYHGHQHHGSHHPHQQHFYSSPYHPSSQSDHHQHSASLSSRLGDYGSSGSGCSKRHQKPPPPPVSSSSVTANNGRQRSKAPLPHMVSVHHAVPVMRDYQGKVLINNRLVLSSSTNSSSAANKSGSSSRENRYHPDEEEGAQVSAV